MRSDDAQSNADGVRGILSDGEHIPTSGRDHLRPPQPISPGAPRHLPRPLNARVGIFLSRPA